MGETINISYDIKVKDIKLQQIQTLISRFKFVDCYTFSHSIRVMKYAVEFAKYMNYSNDDVKTLKYGSIIHDIGKIVIPKEILNKKEKLDKEDYEIIKNHPYIGYQIVKNMKFLKDEEKDIVLHHHEQIDGNGYPYGLNGTELSKFCKIISVIDAFDAMISDRPYRSALTIEEAISELWANTGTQFDAHIVEDFSKYIQGVKI